MIISCNWEILQNRQKRTDEGKILGFESRAEREVKQSNEVVFFDIVPLSGIKKEQRCSGTHAAKKKRRNLLEHLVFVG